MSAKRKRQIPKKWLFWCILSDSPFEGESYLTETQIRDNVVLDLVEGIKASRIQVQPIPERGRKALKSVVLGPKKTPTEAEKP